MEESPAGRHPARAGPTRQARPDWAALLRRVFAFDILHCPRCGGRRRIVAVHTRPETLRPLLERLGLAPPGPVRGPVALAPAAGRLIIARTVLTARLRPDCPGADRWRLPTRVPTPPAVPEVDARVVAPARRSAARRTESRPGGPLASAL